MIYHISYDLKKPGRNYDLLYKTLRDMNGYCHALDSTWYISTTLSAESVRDCLKSVMDSSDALLVTHASVPGAWLGLDDDISTWLKNNL